MLTHEIRSSWLEFFKEKGHALPPSASLVPAKDPTLLFTSAGMVQFKGAYLGTETYSYTRAATCQRCFRTTDLENVGRTARHHTFFEMLGNFSFGDYFKEEAIAWAWEYMTRVLPLDPERLYISIFLDDDEAFTCWHDQVGIPEERIVRLGEDSNFWAMGETGPCGPCSEILYDMGKDFGCRRPECSPACECGRYLELWNLVFTQFDRLEDGTLAPLPRKNIDTGAGLERIASVLQGATNNFDIDIIRPLVLRTADELGVIEKQAVGDKRVSLNIIADHLRAMVFTIFDGVLPSNEGRGYVLRRVLRRAFRRGSLLGASGPFLYRLVIAVVNIMKDGYPELVNHSGHVAKVVKLEEERFQETLSKGLSLLDEIMSSLSSKKIIPGKEAFKLFDTYGFPLELTVEEAVSRGWTVDTDEFELEMKTQKKRSRSILPAGVGDDDQELPIREGVQATMFTGYERLQEVSEVVTLLESGQVAEQLSAGTDKQVVLVLNKTPFYAEAGGQVGDRGIIKWDNGTFEVDNVFKGNRGHYLHYGTVVKGTISLGDRVEAEVDRRARSATERHHTATHLLQGALRRIVGEHVHQAGSLVSPDRLRFDFSHYEPLTPEQIIEVEKLVNEKVVKAMAVATELTSFEQALKKGVIALFGEKYGEQVRAVRVGDFSAELCGGTHVHNSGEIGLFKIVSETSIAQGVRRVEALAGLEALRHIQQQERMLDEASHELTCRSADLTERIKQLKKEFQDAKRHQKNQQEKDLKTLADELLERGKNIGGVTLVAGSPEGLDRAALLRLSDFISDGRARTLILLVSSLDKKPFMLAKRTKDIDRIHAGKIVKKMAAKIGGGGGGRPDMAQAGGPKGANVLEALKTGIALATMALQQEA